MPTNEIVELLARMREESERNVAALHVLEQEHTERQSRLAEQIASIQDTEMEVAQIASKVITSAGNARAYGEVLASEQR